MNIRKIKSIIKENKLTDSANLLTYIKEQWDKVGETDLRKIAELANINLVDNSAYYTDSFIVDEIINNLPQLNKEAITVLEPSVGTGNFIYPFIKKFAGVYKQITILLNDIDKNSLKIAQLFLAKKQIPDNVVIKYTNEDFMTNAFSTMDFDYIIGNPPFKRISVKEAAKHNNKITNTAGQFYDKAAKLATVVGMVMPKNVLSTKDYQELRLSLANSYIDTVIDFGEQGFKGVSIETVALISGVNNQGKTRIISHVDNSNKELPQDYITDNKFPSWLIYRNKFFDTIANNMEFNIFTVNRDRQITKNMLTNSGDIRVVRGKNISMDGKEILDIPDYDKYISRKQAEKLYVFNMYNDNNVYLVPNMTYYTRMIKKTKKFIVNGSVAVLRLRPDKSINDKQIAFFAQDKYREFYKLARNKGTKSLNIDNLAVFWFGKLISE